MARIQVDPGLVQSTGSQVAQAASPINQTVGPVQAVHVSAPGFTAADGVNACSASWGTSLEHLGALLRSVGSAISQAGTVYETQESRLSRME